MILNPVSMNSESQEDNKRQQSRNNMIRTPDFQMTSLNEEQNL